MTEHHLALSALGPDRTGLVAEVTEYLTSRGCNLEDSRMAVLGAEFGMLILVSGPPDAIERASADAKQLEKATGLAIVTRRTKSPEEHRRSTAVPYVVNAEALDHEGIVRAVATALHQLGTNIVSLETSAYNAPVTGSPLFRLEALVDVPKEVSPATLRDAMAKVAERENIDIEVRSVARRAQ
jgi:glycine cleavage system transcriptional repressor